LGEAGDLSQELPIARNRDLSHPPAQQRIERLDMERARRAGHFGLLSPIRQMVVGLRSFDPMRRK
jgi:hypothetical protein